MMDKDLALRVIHIETGLRKHKISFFGTVVVPAMTVQRAIVASRGMEALFRVYGQRQTFMFSTLLNLDVPSMLS